MTARTAVCLALTALGDDHPGVLGLAHEHHRIQYGLGRLAEAAEGFDAVIEMRGRVLGPRHPDTLELLALPSEGRPRYGRRGTRRGGVRPGWPYASRCSARATATP